DTLIEALKTWQIRASRGAIGAKRGHSLVRKSRRGKSRTIRCCRKQSGFPTLRDWLRTPPLHLYAGEQRNMGAWIVGKVVAANELPYAPGFLEFMARHVHADEPLRARRLPATPIRGRRIRPRLVAEVGMMRVARERRRRGVCGRWRVEDVREVREPL